MGFSSPSEFRERGNNEIPLDRTIKTSCFADVLGALIIPGVGAEGGTRRQYEGSNLRSKENYFIKSANRANTASHSSINRFKFHES